VVPEGTEAVKVNELIGWILEEGESASDIPADGAAAAPAAAAPAPAKAEAAAAAAAPAQATAAPARSGERVFASPLAKRIAKQAGIDLAGVAGSGPRGRIVRADVEKVTGSTRPAAAAAPAPAAAAPAPAAAAPAAKPAAAGPDAKALADLLKIPYHEVANSGMRKTIARRLGESKQTVPHFYLTVDCEIDALLKLRKQLNERHEMKLSVNDYIIKAASLALKKVPEANASWTDAATLFYDRVDMSVAVAIDGGLITPVIKDAANKGLSTISAEMKDLAARARDGKLKPEEFQGGTFSISNLGMFGIKHFEAVINPPQACILAIGAGEQRAVVKDGALAVATVMSVTLSVDHRAVDGAVGARYLQAFKALVEDPTSMLL
jgi:pyruvate dehydrogenase E2 component (dihydrolipoamide acetyltransferase)